VLNNLENVWNGRKASVVTNQTISFLSANGRDWRPTRTQLLAGNRLQLDVEMPGPELYVARLEPYRLSDLDKLLESIKSHPRVKISGIGKPGEGRDWEITGVGTRGAPPRVSLGAGAHSGEPGGNGVVRGLTRRLLKDDEAARHYRERYCVYVLP